MLFKTTINIPGRLTINNAIVIGKHKFNKIFKFIFFNTDRPYLRHFKDNDSERTELVKAPYKDFEIGFSNFYNYDKDGDWPRWAFFNLTRLIKNDYTFNDKVTKDIILHYYINILGISRTFNKRIKDYFYEPIVVESDTKPRD